MIRPCREEDAVGLTSSLHALESLSTIAAESFEVTLARVKKQLAHITRSAEHTLLVATEKERLTAYISAHWQPTLLHADGEGFVSELFVHPEERSRGLGTSLLSCIIQEGKARGCARLSLLNMRNKTSYERAYYSKRGWQERPNAANFVLNLRAVNHEQRAAD